MKTFYATTLIQHKAEAAENNFEFQADSFTDAAHYLDGFFRGLRFAENALRCEILSLGTSRKRNVEYVNLETL